MLAIALWHESLVKGLNRGIKGPLGIIGQLLERHLSSPGHLDLQPKEILLSVPTVDCGHIVEVVQPVFPAPLSGERLRKYDGLSMKNPSYLLSRSTYYNCSTWNSR